MEIHEARQTAEGKWNWTVAIDGKTQSAAPCFDEGSFERCDHQTRELAEWHFYEYELKHLAESISDSKEKCEKPGCKVYTRRRISSRALVRERALCGRHQKAKYLLAVQPFVPHVQVST